MDKGELHTWNGTKNRTFDGFFCSPMGINPHDFVKDHPIFKNKGLFYAKFGRVLQEIFFMLQKSILCGMGLRTSFGPIGANRFTKP